MFTFIAGATTTGAVRRQVKRGQKIVCNAMRKLGQDIGRRRGHHQRLGPLRLANVLNAVLLAGGIARAAPKVVPQARDHPMPAERSKGKRLHKFAGRLGHHHVHFQCLPLQSAHQFRGLVCSNPARHAHCHSHGSIVDQ